MKRVLYLLPLITSIAPAVQINHYLTVIVNNSPLPYTLYAEAFSSRPITEVIDESLNPWTVKIENETKYFSDKKIALDALLTTQASRESELYRNGKTTTEIAADAQIIRLQKEIEKLTELLRPIIPAKSYTNYCPARLFTPFEFVPIAAFRNQKIPKVTPRTFVKSSAKTIEIFDTGEQQKCPVNHTTVWATDGKTTVTCCVPRSVAYDSLALIINEDHSFKLITFDPRTSIR